MGMGNCPYPSSMTTIAYQSSVLILTTPQFLASFVIIFIGLAALSDRFLAPRLKLRHRMNFYGYIFIAIPFVYFVVVLILPMLEAFQFSFLKYNILGKEKPFIGLENYQYLLRTELFSN